MIYNGIMETSPAALYTVLENTNGAEITMVRVVNESGADRTFTVYLNVNGTAQAITPIDTQLPIGACFDDFPVFQLPAGGIILGQASGSDVSWTVNSVQL